MSDMDALVKAYERFVEVPWSPGLAPPQRVWMVVYPPRDERRLRARVTAFEIATSKAGHRWRLVDLTDSFARWLGSHPYRDTYFKNPQLLSAAAIKDFERHLLEEVGKFANDALEDDEAVVAVLGMGALFPFTKVSRFLEAAAPLVRGRFVVFFPGERDGSNYRLLEARDGWNYLATPITAVEDVL
jgi:hypothetical protein